MAWREQRPAAAGFAGPDRNLARVRRYLAGEDLEKGRFACPVRANDAVAIAGSRFDVDVIVNKIEGDFLEREAGLYRKRREIDDRIESILLESGHDPSGFVNTVLSTGEIIFKRDDQPKNDGDVRT